MSKSLQEQLLGAGIANKKQANKAKKAKNQKIKQKKSGIVVKDDTAEKIQQEQAAKAERDRELNRQRDEAAAEKALQAQIKQIIEHSRQARPQEGELKFNFTDSKHVRYIQVSEEQQRHLALGYLAIASLNDDYELIPAAAAEKIQSRNPQAVVLWNQKDASVSESGVEEDDPYADYQIPDDLMW